MNNDICDIVLWLWEDELYVVMDYFEYLIKV